MEYISEQNPASPIIGQLVGPLMCIPVGVGVILLWRVQRLRKRHSSFRSGLLDAYSWPFSSPVFGVLWIWIGSSQLISHWLNLDSNQAIQILLFGSLVGVIGMFAELLILLLKSRRTPLL